MPVSLTVEEATKHPDGTLVTRRTHFVAGDFDAVMGGFRAWQHAVASTCTIEWMDDGRTETVDALRERHGKTKKDTG